MRLRPSHIAILVVLALTGFVGLVAWRQNSTPTVTTSMDRDQAFIEEMRQRAESRQGAGERGALPGSTTGAQFVPVLDFGMEEFDGGVVPNHEVTRFEVPVHNRGQGNLTIYDIQTSCSACTLGRMVSDEPIAPGRAGLLEVTINPGGIPGFESHQMLTLYSNDPHQPRASLLVSVRVQPEFDLEPLEVDFGAVSAGEPATRTMRLRPLEDEPVTLTEIQRVDVGQPMLAYAFATTPEDTWARPGFPEYEITLTLRPDAPLGEWTEYFILHNSTLRLATFRRQASGVIVPPASS